MRIVIDLQACQAVGSRHRGIGRYSLALAQAMARHAGRHEIRLTLNGAFADSVMPVREAFADLIPAQHIHVWRAPGPMNGFDPSNLWRARAGELLREQMLAELRPDIVHVASLFEGLGDDALTSIGASREYLPTAVTLYDLIPLVHSKPYLDNPHTRHWYYRKLQALKNADLLLAISEASRQEGLEWLHLPDERIVNISSAVDARFCPQPHSIDALLDVRRRYGLVRPFVMYTGGIDHRKNIEALIRAYAALPSRRDYQLAIVCSAQEADRQRLQKLAQQAGMANDELVLTGFVPDDDLPLLYHDCALFVFPSWHEGFGLPALEAMACGAPVIGANCSSLPEVIGRDDALFNPRSESSITSKMQHALSDENFRNELRAHGLQQARKFSWDASAKRALQAFEEQHARRQTTLTVPSTALVPQRKPSLAFLAPLPPERSGIADYCAELLPELARYYDIELIVRQPELIDDPWLVANFPLRDWRWFDANASRFERVLYHFGNSAFHSHMFGLLARHPGVVVLHDFFLSGVLRHMELTEEMPDCWSQALYQSHGYQALLEKKQAADAHDIMMQYPCNLDVLNRADGIIVHARHSSLLAQQWHGPEAAESWALIPHLRRKPVSGESAAAVRARLGIDKDDFLVCSFGLVGPTKLNHRLLQAWLDTPLARDPRCHLVFVGENYGGPYGVEFLATITASECADRIKITGFAEPELFRAYLAAADAAVQLRTLSRGETSGTVLDCMVHGVATIVNAHAAMAELPEHALVKLPDEFTDAALSEKLVALWEQPELRQSLGQRAVEHIQSLHAPAEIGARYFSAIERFAQTEPQARRRRTISSMAAIEAPTAPTEADLAGIASGLSANRRIFGNRQLLVDVSAFALQDAAADSRCHALNVVLALVAAPPHGYRVEPVFSGNDGLRYARQLTCRLLDIPALAGDDAPIETRAGDMFIDPTFGDHSHDHRQLLARLADDGVACCLTKDDLLPLLHSGFFSETVRVLLNDCVRVPASAT